MKYLFLFLFLLGLWYIVLPVPHLTRDFISSQNAVIGKSSEVKYIFYTNQWRSSVTEYYQKKFRESHCQGNSVLNLFCYINPIILNYSPLLATTLIDSKQQSTYLEEYIYPLKDSIIVNGYEPYDQNGKQFDKSSQPLVFNGKQYHAQVTVRYYSSSFVSRIFIYLFICLSIYFEIRLFKKLRG
jgi:hypothetical protein